MQAFSENYWSLENEEGIGEKQNNMLKQTNAYGNRTAALRINQQQNATNYGGKMNNTII